MCSCGCEIALTLTGFHSVGPQKESQGDFECLSQETNSSTSERSVRFWESLRRVLLQVAMERAAVIERHVPASP